MFARLVPQVPAIQLPHLPALPGMPFLGCFPADGQTYVGKKWANRPDLRVLDHVRQLKKHLEEEIITHTIGKLDNPLRAAGFAEEIARLEVEIDEAIDTFYEVVGSVTGEINASLGFIGDRQEELNQARDELLSIPAGARSKVEQRLLERYDEYFGELEAQGQRLQSTLNCLMSF